MSRVLSNRTASKTRLRLWIQLLRSTRSIETELRERLRRGFDATLPRFDVLAALYRQPDGMLMSELSRYLMVSNGNVTGIVDRLVADRLVVRAQRDGDRRASIVRLTKKGVNDFERMAAAHEEWVNELLAEFDRKQTESLTKTFKQLNPHTAKKRTAA